MMWGGRSTMVRGVLLAGLSIAVIVTAQPTKAQDMGAEKIRLEQLLANTPQDADLLLRYGNLLGNMGDYESALQAFDRALAVAPDYIELYIARARVLGFAGRIDEGMAVLDGVLANTPSSSSARAMRGRLLYYRGDVAAAAEDFSIALEIDPTNTMAQSGLVDAQNALQSRSADNDLQARSAVDAWRVDMSYARSTFGRAARKPWQEKTVRLEHAISTDVSAHLQVRDARRGAQVDQEYQGGMNVKLTPGVGLYVNLGATPHTDFLPRWHFESGATWQVREGLADEWMGATVLNLDGRLRHYPTGNTINVNPGMTQYLFGGDAWATATWLNGVDTATDKHLPGWAVRGDWQGHDRLKMFAGYANAPEVDGGRKVGVTSEFVGVTVKLMDNLDATAALSQERRKQSYTRNEATLSLGVRF